MLGLIGPRDAEVALLFDGHMDVVPVTGSWRSDPFGGEIRDGRLHGRGSTDEGRHCRGDLWRRGGALGPETPRGRVGQRAGKIIEAMRWPRCSTSARRDDRDLQPSKLQIKAGQKGRVELLLTFHGKPAHAATPHVGVNPLHAAAKALTVLKHCLCHMMTCWGRRCWFLPTSCRILSVDLHDPGRGDDPFRPRTVSGERLEDVLAQIRGHLAGHGLSDFTWR